jgi:hypothetical protein
MLTPDKIIVRIEHARKLHGGCVLGWKTFLESHGYDFKTVVREGLTAQQLLDTKDSLAIELANYVIKITNENSNS